MDLINKMGLQDPFYPKSAIVTAFEEVEQRICCIEEELKPLAALCGPGGVVFTNAANEVINDCDNFFWDNTDFRLGIGTNTPSTQLHILHTDVLYPSATATIESQVADADIHLRFNDTFGSTITYQNGSTSVHWRVGIPGITENATESFAWMDGSNVNNIRLELMRSGFHNVGSASSLRFYDGQTITQNYFSLRAPDVLAADTDYIFPTGYPAVAGDVLSSNLTGDLSWVTPGGGGQWALNGSDLYSLNSSYTGTGTGSNTIGGAGAASAGMTGLANTIYGSGSLNSLSTGNANVALGNTEAGLLANGSFNVLVGNASAPLLTAGSRNIILGEMAALSFPDIGNDNLLIGNLTAQGLGGGAFPLNPGSHSNILIGKSSLSAINDYKPGGVPAAGHANGWEELITIGTQAGNWANTQNANQSIFIGYQSGPIQNDIYSATFGGFPYSKNIFSVTSGTRNQGGAIGQDGGQIVLYGSEKNAASNNTYGRQLMVSGGNVGDYTGAPPAVGAPPCQTPNATLHVVGNGSTDAAYVATNVFNSAGAGGAYFGDAALIVEDGAGFADGSAAAIGSSNPLLIVDHDGVVRMPNLPLGPGVAPVGLPAGSLWVDTAAGNVIKYV